MDLESIDLSLPNGLLAGEDEKISVQLVERIGIDDLVLSLSGPRIVEVQVQMKLFRGVAILHAVSVQSYCCSKIPIPHHTEVKDPERSWHSSMTCSFCSKPQVMRRVYHIFTPLDEESLGEVLEALIHEAVEGAAFHRDPTPDPLSLTLLASLFRDALLLAIANIKGSHHVAQ